MKYSKIILLSIVISIIHTTSAQNHEWHQWRGPQSDGSTMETDWGLEKIMNGKAILWTTNVGTGHSAVAINGDRLYTMGNWEITDSNFVDRVICLDANTAKLIWQFEYPMNEGEDPGPFATPVFDDGRVYTLGRGGQLYCFNAADGAIIWEKNLISQGLTHEEGEYACSPVVVDELLVFNINLSGLALYKESGQVAWNSEIAKGSLSTAVAFDLDGNTYVSIQRDGKTLAVNAKNGSINWELPEGHISDPYVHQDEFLIYSYKGSSLYDLKSNPPVRIWNNLDVKASFQSYVSKDGYAFGFSSRGMSKLICFEIATGDIKWAEKMSAGSLIVSNDLLVVIDKEGILRFVEASPVVFKEVATASVLEMVETDTKNRGYRRINGCWTNPVLCNKKIYVRNSYGDLVCVDVS